MKLSYSIFSVAGVLGGVAGFAPGAASSSRSDGSALSMASIEATGLKPPQKIADLATTTQDLYGKSVQSTYGYVTLRRMKSLTSVALG
jgi:hypothetical protein